MVAVMATASKQAHARHSEGHPCTLSFSVLGSGVSAKHKFVRIIPMAHASMTAFNAFNGAIGRTNDRLAVGPGSDASKFNTGKQLCSDGYAQIQY